MGPFLTREGEYDLQSSGLMEKAESAEHVNVDAESGIVEDVCSVDVAGRWGKIEQRRGTTPEPPSDGDDGGRSGKRYGAW